MNSISKCLGLLLITLNAHADYSFRLADTESCDKLTGNWSGKARVKNWAIGTCKYIGTGTVGPVDSSGHFTIYGKADKDYGVSLCPDHASQQLNGVCANGVVSIKTDYGKLKGTFSENSGNAKGTLAVSPGIEADVSVEFYRDN